MPFAKRGDVVHSEATSGFNNQKKSLLINGLAALGDSHHPLQLAFRGVWFRRLCHSAPECRDGVCYFARWVAMPGQIPVLDQMAGNR